MEAAAQEYFGKHVEDLNLAEVAMLAGLPKAPSRYAPTSNPTRAKERQAYVLNRMVEAGFVSVAEAQEALKQPLTLKPLRHERFYDVGYYVDYVRQLLEERYGRGTRSIMPVLGYTPRPMLSSIKRPSRPSSTGLKELYSRHGFRGPLKELTAKEIEPFCQQQVAYQQKHPPMKGHLQGPRWLSNRKKGSNPWWCVLPRNMAQSPKIWFR